MINRSQGQFALSRGLYLNYIRTYFLLILVIPDREADCSPPDPDNV